MLYFYVTFLIFYAKYFRVPTTGAQRILVTQPAAALSFSSGEWIIQHGEAFVMQMRRINLWLMYRIVHWDSRNEKWIWRYTYRDICRAEILPAFIISIARRGGPARSCMMHVCAPKLNQGGNWFRVDENYCWTRGDLLLISNTSFVQ